MVKEKKCFIITPIGDKDSEIFRKINGVISSVIRPLLLDNGFSVVKAAHEISEPGMINLQIVSMIVDSDLVVANITGNNPNVMYELCLRHVVAKPIIHICEEGTKLPFDIYGNRTIFYTNDMAGANELKNDFLSALSTISYEKEYKDNPIYYGQHIGELLKNYEKSNKSIELQMLNEILDTIKYNQTETRKGELVRIEIRTEENLDNVVKLSKELFYKIIDMGSYINILLKDRHIFLIDKMEIDDYEVIRPSLEEFCDKYNFEMEITKYHIVKFERSFPYYYNKKNKINDKI